MSTTRHVEYTRSYEDGFGTSNGPITLQELKAFIAECDAAKAPDSARVAIPATQGTPSIKASWER